jgi:predicted transposase YdaD
MLTLKEKLEHGDLDDALTRDEVKQILDLFETADDLDLLDEARDEARDEGKEEGREEGKQEGEESEFDRLKDRYLEIKEDLPEDKGVRLLEFIKKLDELFEVDNG